MSLNIDQVIIVGAGPMAVSYAQVLRSASIPAKIIGRSESSAAKCSEQTGIRVVTGGVIFKRRYMPLLQRVSIPLKKIQSCF